MKKIKVLLVEDDPNLGQILKEYLEVKGFESLLFTNGESALKGFNRGLFDICIFDVMMPKMDGFTLAEQIRKRDTETPILFLTAKSMKEDTIRAFEIGADDFMTKPFSMEELILRIKAILKRTSKVDPDNNIYTIGKFQFEIEPQKLLFEDGSDQKLTSKETALLKMLCQNKNKVLDRSIALKKIWFDDNYFNSRSMDVYITKLRQFLKKDKDLQIINIHGQGFKLIELNN